MTNFKDLASFLFEMGHANETKNVGWKLIKVDDQSNVSLSEHAFRNAIIAFILATLEKAENPYKCAMAGLLHKIHKIRLGDRHKVSANYLDYPPDVKKMIKNDQLSMLGDELKDAFEEIYDLTEDERLIIKDADQLEFALEAKAFLDKGYTKAEVWLERIEAVLQTESAKELFKELKQMHSCDWWENLKKAPQTKKEDYIARV